MHVQSSCLVNPNLLIFCRSRCRRRRRCLNCPARSQYTIPETIVGRISLPVSFSLFLKWRMDNGMGVSITAAQSKQRTIPREPAGGTGTIVNCDTNSIKAILNPRASVVSNLGKTL